MKGRLEEIRLSTERISPSIEWFRESHGQSVDTNPKSNGRNPVCGTSSLDIGSGEIDFSSNNTPAYTVRTTGSAYVRHIKEYENIVNAIRTQGQHDFVSEALSKVFQDVMSMDAPRNRSAARAQSDDSTEEPLIASLNPVDTANSYARQKPVNSPSKFRK